MRYNDNFGNTVQILDSAQNISGAAAAGTGVTLTITPAANQFVFIHKIQMQKFASALLVAAATPVIVTTTNLGGVAFYFSAGAEAQGTMVDKETTWDLQLKSTVVGTPVTIVFPAVTNVIWNANLFYNLATD